VLLGDGAIQNVNGPVNQSCTLVCISIRMANGEGRSLLRTALTRVSRCTAVAEPTRRGMPGFEQSKGANFARRLASNRVNIAGRFTGRFASFQLKCSRGEAEEAPMTTKIPAENIALKRAYDEPSPEDGPRILVDRLWPRGVTKQKAGLDRWIKELAPSTELRKWFGHDPDRWPKFRRRYQAELKDHTDLLNELRELARRHRITLVYSAHDEQHNDAVVLREALLD
jgi:uncharacterized protein YeaO (DUF488 family)